MTSAYLKSVFDTIVDAPCMLFAFIYNGNWDVCILLTLINYWFDDDKYRPSLHKLDNMPYKYANKNLIKKMRTFIAKCEMDATSNKPIEHFFSYKWSQYADENPRLKSAIGLEAVMHYIIMDDPYILPEDIMRAYKSEYLEPLMLNPIRENDTSIRDIEMEEFSHEDEVYTANAGGVSNISPETLDNTRKMDAQSSVDDELIINFRCKKGSSASTAATTSTNVATTPSDKRVEDSEEDALQIPAIDSRKRKKGSNTAGIQESDDESMVYKKANKMKGAKKDVIVIMDEPASTPKQTPRIKNENDESTCVDIKDVVLERLQNTDAKSQGNFEFHNNRTNELTRVNWNVSVVKKQ